MNTLEFFGKVLAHRGLVCLLHLDGDRRRQGFYPSHQAAAAAALTLDARGGAVYYGCSTFKTDENRKQENAAFMRSFWVDADVDPANPEKYPDLKAALIDIGRVARELRLPLPLIVRSGNGAHVYYPLAEDLPAVDWHRGAALYKDVLRTAGFRQDPTRTADSSSVLRPVGTHWRKNEQRRVEALNDCVPLDPRAFLSRLEEYASRNGLQPVRHFDPGVCGSDDLSAGIEYPPSSAERVAAFCPTIAHIAAERGNVSEPLWRGMLGVVKFTVEGDQRCHEWSAGHPEYDEAATQDKIDRWAAAPTTCAHFRAIPGSKCAGCPRQVTSPIQLGYLQEGNPPPAPVEAAAGLTTTPVQPEEIPHWPKRNFHWNGRAVCRAITNAEGVVDWLPFCETKFYPVQRVYSDEKSGWSLLCKYEKLNGRTGTFSLPTALLGKSNELHAALAAQEIVMTGAQGVRHAQEYLREYMLSLQRANEEQLTYDQCGWADEQRSYIIGNERITASGVDVVRSGPFMQAAKWNCSFGRSGSVESWSRLVNDIYGRAGAEPYQFIFMTAFAAPLVEVLGSDNWHGIPIALIGPPGTGKTSTCRLACSIYGQGARFVLNAATFNALIARIGVIHNLPIVFDEVTSRDKKELADLLYGLSNGRPKERVGSDGKLLNAGVNWSTMSFLTSNRSILELLPALNHADVVDATQVRIFEVTMTPQMLAMWRDRAMVDIVEHKLGEEYGEVGRIWLPYVIKNRATLREELRELRSALSAMDTDQSKERFYRDALVHAVVAAKHARKLGLVDFDPITLAKWGQKHIVALRQARDDTKAAVEDRVAHFLGTLNGHTIVTQHFRDGRGVVETPLDPVRGVPLARMALQDRVFIVAARAIADWCNENSTSQTWLLEQLRQRNMLVHQGATRANGSRKERLGRGTSIPSAPEYVFELDYDKVIGHVDTKTSEETNGQSRT